MITVDYSFKILLIGDCFVGKTTILNRLCGESPTISYVSTIGVDFKEKIIDVDDKKVKLRVWDTAGQERFNSITTAYYRGASAIILVYDVTDEFSFKNIQKWISMIESHSNENVKIFLIGNKCDLVSEKIIERSKGKQIAERHKCLFFETSAKLNINIKETFETVAYELMTFHNKRNNNMIVNQSVVIPKKKSTKECCRI